MCNAVSLVSEAVQLSQCIIETTARLLCNRVIHRPFIFRLFGALAGSTSLPAVCRWTVLCPQSRSLHIRFTVMLCYSAVFCASSVRSSRFVISKTKKWKPVVIERLTGNTICNWTSGIERLIYKRRLKMTANIHIHCIFMRMCTTTAHRLSIGCVYDEWFYGKHSRNHSAVSHAYRCMI